MFSVRKSLIYALFWQNTAYSAIPVNINED